MEVSIASGAVVEMDTVQLHVAQNYDYSII